MAIATTKYDDVVTDAADDGAILMPADVVNKNCNNYIFLLFNNQINLMFCNAKDCNLKLWALKHEVRCWI